MMKTLLAAVKASISEVMETMFFLPVDFSQEPAQKFMTSLPVKHRKSCCIDFKGDFSGRVFFMVPEKLLFEMAENFMGEIRERVSDEMLEGTLTESLNMIAGNALRKLDEKNSFELSIPKIIKESEFPVDDGAMLIETTGSKMILQITLSA